MCSSTTTIITIKQFALALDIVACNDITQYTIPTYANIPGCTEGNMFQNYTTNCSKAKNRYLMRLFDFVFEN